MAGAVARWRDDRRRTFSRGGGRHDRRRTHSARRRRHDRRRTFSRGGGDMTDDARIPAEETALVTGPITVVHDDTHHRYNALVAGRLAGKADYRVRPGIVIFYHTEVDEAYE